MKIKENREKEFTEVIPKKVVIFAGKSCVQDIEQNKMISLILQVAELVNTDEEIQNSLKVIFLPNFNVTVAEKILPACDLFQNLKTPGSNCVNSTCTMKALMNGALVLGSKWGTNLDLDEYYSTQLKCDRDEKRICSPVMLFGADFHNTSLYR